MVRCIDCRWAKKSDKELRWNMSQENKEILNVLEQQGFDLEEFRYCEVLGYIESTIMQRKCEKWENQSYSA